MHVSLSRDRKSITSTRVSFGSPANFLSDSALSRKKKKHQSDPVGEKSTLEMRRGGGGRRGSGNYSNPCLTMHQPWASLLVYGIKRIEGRSWTAPIRGNKKNKILHS
jgi:hypothetical protein